MTFVLKIYSGSFFKSIWFTWKSLLLPLFAIFVIYDWRKRPQCIGFFPWTVQVYNTFRHCSQNLLAFENFPSQNSSLRLYVHAVTRHFFISVCDPLTHQHLPFRNSHSSVLPTISIGRVKSWHIYTAQTHILGFQCFS